MKIKLLIFFLYLLFFSSIVFIPPQKTYAADPCILSLDQPTVTEDFIGHLTITSDVDCFKTAAQYSIFWYPEGEKNNRGWRDIDVPPTTPTSLTFEFNYYGNTRSAKHPGTWVVYVCNGDLESCRDEKEGYVLGRTSLIVSSSLTSPSPPPPENLPIIDRLSQPQCTFQAGSPVTLTVTNTQQNKIYNWWWKGDRTAYTQGTIRSDENGSVEPLIIPGEKTKSPGVHTVCVDIEGLKRSEEGNSQNCISLTFTPGPPTGDTSCKPETPPSPPPSFLPPCPNDSGGLDTEKGGCPKFNTALGPIWTEPGKFIGSVMGIILSLSGGIAVLIIIFAGYKMMASKGDPEKAEDAREMITSAVIGLLFIIFSLVIFEVIGVDILKLPCFNDATCEATQTSPGQPADAPDCGGDRKGPCLNPNSEVNEARGILDNGCRQGMDIHEKKGYCFIPGGG